jgi:alginate O-acetyltransferase complex protein AlgI
VHGGVLAFERGQGKHGFYHKLPRPVRVGLTFFIVLLTWVLFRTADLPTAMSYFGSLFGTTPRQTGADLVGGILYQPYYVMSFILAGIVTWTFPSMWAWTQKLTLTKAMVCLGVFWLSLIVLLTQAYNPFIYFIF